MKCFALACIAAGAILVGGGVNAQDQRFTYPEQYTMSPKGVNIQTGRFNHSKTDISIGNLQFVRSWGDASAFSVDQSHALGFQTKFARKHNGWVHSHSQGTSASDGTINLFAGGQRYTHKYLADGTPVPWDKSSQGTLIAMVSGKWVLRDKSGNTFTFFPHAALSQTGYSNAPNQVLESVTYANGSRTDYSYNSNAQPRVISSNSGYALVLDYDGNQNVSAVCGFNTAITAVDSNSTCAGAALKASYGYDSSGKLLTSVTNVSGTVVTMSYVSLNGAAVVSDGPVLPACISLPDSATCEIQNLYGIQPGDTGFTGHRDQVRVQTTANGTVWRYDYEPEENSVDVPPLLGRPRWSYASMTDPTGFETNATYDRGHLVSLVGVTGTTNYKYANIVFTVPSVLNFAGPVEVEFHDDVPKLVTPPNGLREYFEHDDRGNVTLHSYWPIGSPPPLLSNGNPAIPTDPDLATCCISVGTPVFPPGSITYAQTFPPSYGGIGLNGNVYVWGCGSGPADAKLCNKPTKTIDPKGNETDYTYDPAHGGVLTETAPAVNGVRAQTRYTYEQRYAWIKNAGGAYVQAATPTWLLVAKSFCKAGSASGNMTLGSGCMTSGDEVVTTYDYGPTSGPNNLQLRGVKDDALGSASRLTCSAYDWMGNKISETKPRAGLTVCP